MAWRNSSCLVSYSSLVSVQEEQTTRDWKRRTALVYRDYGVIPKSSRDDNFNKASDDLSKYQIVEVGDLVINKMKAWQGSLAVSEYDGIVSPAYFVFRALITTDLRFMHYLMRSIRYFQHYASISSGVRPNQWDLDPDLHRLMPVLVPPLSEQSNIAAYLDRETAEIDAFIADQEELIELLSERRTATITRAVTKGLEPNAPMKDSGVEWLGEIPAHWNTQQIKWLSPVKRGASPRPIDDPIYFDASGDWAWVRIADVTASGGRLRQTTQLLSALGSSKSVKLQAQQLFISIAGSVGKPCITEIDVCIHDGFVYFPHLTPDLSEFLYRIFEAGQCYQGLGKLGTQLNLNTDTIGSISIPVPPAEEILEILVEIDRELSVVDEAIADARTAITLSKERRAAVISAAVTGKIDVRGLVDLATSIVEGASVGAA